MLSGFYWQIVRTDIMPLLGLSERTIRTPLRKGVRLSDSLSGFGMTQNPVKKGKMERTENAPPPPAGTTLEMVLDRDLRFTPSELLF